MPKYNLLCTRDHEFEGWFASEESYLDQKNKKLIACPICDNTGIRRAVMAPNVNLKSKKLQSKKSNTAFYNSRSTLQHLKTWVEKNCENVGDNFAKEARKASLGERDDHIYGTASDKEIKDLHKEGIGAIRIPNVKDN
jgi:hypothetical protein|tara:strand:- start:401 stop:814 length:414 start_codon:yes stop_codon:yes gene_type:complete